MPPFAGTTGVGILDNISCYHQFQDESRQWAADTGGAVVELHAYGLADDNRNETTIQKDLLAALHTLYPETTTARIIDQRYLLRNDCPAFSCGSHQHRPGVATPFPMLTLAGDFVRLPFPSALMERAAASGFVAANHILKQRGLAPEPVPTITKSGLLAPLLRPWTRQRQPTMEQTL